ncbi:hypothetical protein JXA47_00565 [Candidatus Sumerlaeota bacterium]|nr:hypothetical protein [Candidatus Sumerlaeota bacterium]
MMNRRTLIGLALGTLLLVSSLSAATYSLPDAGVLAGGSVNTDLNVSNGTGQAAINLSIRYNPNVATPGTVVVGSGLDGTWTIAQNILTGVAANTDELRVVVYRDPTAEFPAGNQAVISIPWNAVGAAGDSTELYIRTPADVSAGEVTSGVSDASGTSLTSTSNFASGNILILTPVTSDPMVAQNMTTWISFQQLPWPFNLESSPGSGVIMPPPYIDHNDPTDPGNAYLGTGGVSPVTLTTTADGSRDGVAGFTSPRPALDYTADSVYLIEWTVNNVQDADASITNPCTYRVTGRDNADNTLAQINVTPYTIAARNNSTVTIPMIYEPSDVSSNDGQPPAGGIFAVDGLRFDIDVIDFDAPIAGVTSLQAVEITRFDKPTIDPNFQDVFDIGTGSTNNFTDPNLWANLDFGSFTLNPMIPGDDTTVNIIEQATYAETDNVVTVSTALTGSTGDSIGYYAEFGVQATAGVENQRDVVWRQVVDAYTPTGSDPNSNGTIRLRFTDETQTMSSAYQVLSVGSRNFGPATGINRPPAETSGLTETYYCYFTYPEDSDVDSLLDSTASDNMLAFVGVLDLEDFIQGSIAFTNLTIQATPKATFALP